MEIYSKVKELRDLIKNSEEVSKEIERLRAPLLTDLCHIGTIYSFYLELLHRRGWSRSNVYHRGKFIFAILYFYSPITLAGGSTEKGVRDEIARIVGVVPTTISTNISEMGFSYAYYSDFRADVDSICSEVAKRFKV